MILEFRGQCDEAARIHHPTRQYGGGVAARAIANGEAEIGMTQISEILPYAGAELVGPFPAEIQLITSFATAVGANARQSEPAKALIKFLTAPAAAPVFKAKGLDPTG
jgi:molybdate transport system substrate-binding protein